MQTIKDNWINLIFRKYIFQLKESSSVEILSIRKSKNIIILKRKKNKTLFVLRMQRIKKTVKTKIGLLSLPVV